MQAIGATTPAFTAALSLAILGTKESARTYLALLPVVVGIVIATGAEPSFNMAGFSAAIVATSARAFKSVLQVQEDVTVHDLAHCHKVFKFTCLQMF